MKHFILSILLLGSVSGYSQFPDQPAFFNSNKLPSAGAYYYPEQWDPSEWDRDFKKMASLGFAFTHFGEFAWANMEPEEGKYNFKWLEDAIHLADKNGLKVILCTPTPAPPAWLSEKYPEILVYNSDGIQMQHGSREHGSWSSNVYRDRTAKIVGELAKRFGNDHRVLGWQLDNEPSHYSVIYDYSPAALEKFREWLQVKYSSIDSLNKYWGNAFWSQSYNNFNQIRIPNQKELVQAVNPHALLDFQEFTNAQRGDFLRLQAQILRKNISAGQFITTNYMMQLPHIDPWVNEKDLDFASYTNYPVNSYSATDGGDLGFRLGAGQDLSFSHEFYESVNGYTGIMELQPGQVNWGRYNTQPLPGAVRMWIWHSVALGAKFVCTYRFRQPLYGNEQYHAGIIGTDGVSLSRGGEEFVKAIKEINLLQKEIDDQKNIPEKGSSSIAILFDQRSLLDMYNFPHTQRWNPVAHLMTYYTSLKSMGLNVVFVNSNEEFNSKKYPVMIAPAIQLVDDVLIEKWNTYVKSGGHLVLTCRTGQKDKNGHLFKLPLQKKISDLIGTDILFNDQLPETKSGSLSINGKKYQWSIFADVLKIPNEKSKDIKVLATYDDQFYKGKVAAIKNETGKGTVTYIGAYSVDGLFEKDILRNVFAMANVSILDLPATIFIEELQGYKVAVNYSSEAYQLPFSDKVKIFMGEKIVKPGEVTIWKEQ